MQTQVVLNSEKIRNVSHLSHTAEVVITYLSQRERLRAFSDITRTRNALIRMGEKIVDSDYLAFWKGLQDAGVGVIVLGKNKKAERFEWHYSMKKVASAALEGKDIVASPLSIPNEPKTIKRVSPVKRKTVHMSKASKAFVTAKAPQPRGNERVIFIPLRKDYDLQFSLPQDLSKDEMALIQRYLSRLSA